MEEQMRMARGSKQLIYKGRLNWLANSSAPRRNDGTWQRSLSDKWHTEDEKEYIHYYYKHKNEVALH